MNLVMLAVSGQVEDQIRALHRAGICLLAVAVLLLLAAVLEFFRLHMLQMIRLESGLEARKRIRQLNSMVTEAPKRMVPAATAGYGSETAETVDRTVPLHKNLQSVKTQGRKNDFGEGFVMELDLEVVHSDERL